MVDQKTDEKYKKVVTKKVTIKQVQSWLSLSDEQLFILVINEMRTYLRWSPIFILLGSRKPWVVVRIYHAYKELKDESQRLSGSMLAGILGHTGGGRFCETTEYCRRKSNLKELFDCINDTPELTTLFADRIETIEWLAETIKESVEEIGDAAFPVSFIFISIKYGLDDLCKCCTRCDGLGYVQGKKCEKCNGTGISKA